ncbi:TPA: hypothetical protein KPJ80_000333 [Clostridioides difficile]|nr:hypothetical protein [Clostridioides difficile]HBG2164311.1 hypothetical protein [Clostridioides difficile]
MSKLENQIQRIRLETRHRILELTHMFSELNITDEVNESNNSSIGETFESNKNKIDKEDILKKYFLERSIVVFSYATVEKFIKSLTQECLTAIFDNEYFLGNNVKEFFHIVKNKNKPQNIFELLIYYKDLENTTSEYNFDYAVDKGHFSKRDRIDSTAIYHIIKVLNLNRNEPFLKVPKMTLDSICKKRMSLAHGDYIEDLKIIFNERKDTTMQVLNDQIWETFKLNDTTREELREFIKAFSEKITELLYEIDSFQKSINNTRD